MAVDPVVKVEKNLVNPQRWNRYAYALNNPVKYLDPDGKDAVVSVNRETRTVSVTVNVVMSGPAASPAVAKSFQDQANASWGQAKSFTAKDGTKWSIDVKVNATTDSGQFTKADAPNTVVADTKGETGMTGNEGTLNTNDLARPGVSGHEAGHLMGVLDSPDPESPGIMNPNGENPKPTQEEVDQAGQVALGKKKEEK